MKKIKWYDVLFWLYLLILLRITVFRSNFLLGGWCAGEVRWLPFAELFSLLPEGRYGYFIYLFVGNLIWFVPLGAYLAMKDRSLLRSALTGFLLSAAIEIGQFIFTTGTSEVEDVILNTLGCVLGFFLCRLIKKKT